MKLSETIYYACFPDYLRRVPPNCFSEVDDYESAWEFSKPFDFIHGRSLSGSVKDFPMLFQRVKNNLKPGGWVELVDIPINFFSDDATEENAPNIMEWVRLQIEATVKFGKEMDITHKYKQWLIDAGFTNVQEDIYKVCFQAI